jgi:hypothetical protein
MLDRPIVGMRSRAGFNNCHRTMPSWSKPEGCACCWRITRLPLASESFPARPVDVPQPDAPWMWRSDSRPADGCRRANRRLRQDCARNSLGNGFSNLPAIHSRDRTDAGHVVARERLGACTDCGASGAPPGVVTRRRGAGRQSANLAGTGSHGYGQHDGLHRQRSVWACRTAQRSLRCTRQPVGGGGERRRPRHGENQWPETSEIITARSVENALQLWRSAVRPMRSFTSARLPGAAAIPVADRLNRLSDDAGTGRPQADGRLFAGSARRGGLSRCCGVARLAAPRLHDDGSWRTLGRRLRGRHASSIAPSSVPVTTRSPRPADWLRCSATWPRAAPY